MVTEQGFYDIVGSIDYTITVDYGRGKPLIILIFIDEGKHKILLLQDRIGLKVMEPVASRVE